MLEFGSETLIITHDAMAEGTHFRPDADPFDIAWKLVATNLSDLAAKGAEPVGVLLGHMLGEDDARFLEGLHAILGEFNVPLLGGDTIRSDNPRVLGLTAIGRATHTPAPSRTGAKAGDAIYLCGQIGAAMLGFEGDPAHSEAYNRPRPLLAEGQALAPHVSAMMDVSDGLLLDASRMAKASGVSFEISTSALKVADPSRLRDCLSWGDDYALLFTMDGGIECPFPARRIGTVPPNSGDQVLLDGEPVEGPLGYEH